MGVQCRVVWARVLCPILLLLSGAWAKADDSGGFEANYTKREVRIPMRDGVSLFTDVYTPKEPGQYPILLRRTPYNLKPYTVDAGGNPGFGDGLVREKFIFVRQDVRGRFASEGTFVDVRPHKPVKAGPKDTDESTDTWDTIDLSLIHI